VGTTQPRGKPGIRFRDEKSPARKFRLLKWFRLLLLPGLLVLPGWAVWRLSGSCHWLGLYFPAMSLLTYGVYVVDKRRAEAGEWRIPESNLHLLELLGGWPGAFIAQRRVRHKISKASYQVMFWLIVLFYQFAAWDSFHDWRYSRQALIFLEEHASRWKSPSRH